MALLSPACLGFISQIEKSKKILPNILLKTFERDCRSSTGSNLRNILLLTTKDDISDLVPSDVSQMEFQPVNATDEWSYPYMYLNSPVMMKVEIHIIYVGDSNLFQVSSQSV